MRVLVNHAIVSLGNRRLFVALLVAVAGVTILLNLSVYEYFHVNLQSTFEGATNIKAALASARDALVQSGAISGATISLVLLMFTPAQSNLGVAARVAGASYRAIALGQFIPIASGLVLVVVLGGIGSTWFLAQSQLSPVWVLLGLSALGIGYASAVLIVNQVVIGVAERLGVPSVGARILGLGAGFAIIAALLTDLLGSTLRAESSIMAKLSQHLWLGDTLPASAAAAVLTLAVATALLSLLFMTVALSARPVHSVVPRLVESRVWGRPDRQIYFILREILLSLRHPVSQMTLLAAILLSALVVIGSRSGYVPPAVAIYGLAILLSSGVETAWGRSIEWGWMYHVARFPVWKRVGAQFVGSLVPGAVLFAIGIGVVLIGQPLVWNQLAASALAMFAFGAVAYLSGIVLPYNATAPVGMTLTSIVTLGLDAIVLWGQSKIGPPGTAFELLYEVAVIAVALTLATLLITRKSDQARLAK